MFSSTPIKISNADFAIFEDIYEEKFQFLDLNDKKFQEILEKTLINPSNLQAIRCYKPG